MAATRELFLHALRAEYLEQIEEGMLPEHSHEAIALSESVDIAMDDVRLALNDLAPVLRHSRHKSCVVGCLERLDGFLDCVGLDWVEWDDVLIKHGLVTMEHQACYMLTCFIAAHHDAQVKVARFLGATEEVDSPEERAVIAESQAEVARAEQALRLMDRELLQEVRAKQVASIVLEKQRRFVEKLLAQGVLEDKQAHRLLHAISRDLARVSRSDRRTVTRNVARMRRQGSSASHPCKGACVKAELHAVELAQV